MKLCNKYNDRTWKMMKFKHLKNEVARYHDKNDIFSCARKSRKELERDASVVPGKYKLYFVLARAPFAKR